MSLSFGSPVQVAWVTNDLNATETALTGLLGVKKWVRLPDVHFAPDTCSYLGSPADFVAGISLSYLGDMQLELIEPVRGPNIYSDFLRDSGPGLHHICVEADTLENFDAALALAAEQGASVPQQGVMPGGLGSPICLPRNTGFRSWRSRISQPKCGSSSTTSSRSSANEPRRRRCSGHQPRARGT